MPRNFIGNRPFSNLVKIDQDDAVNLRQIANAIDAGGGETSILIRSAFGHKNRGGYFFHLKRSSEKIKLYDFEKNIISVLSGEEALLLINHCCGRKFDEASFDICQQVLNFRSD